MLLEISILHRKEPLAFQTLLKVDLSYAKVPDTHHLAALNLLLATEEPEKLAQCSVGGFTLYALTTGNVTVVCVADPTDPQLVIEVFLKKVFELLVEIDPNNLQTEAGKFILQIRKLAEQVIPSEIARSLAEDYVISEEKRHSPIKLVFLGLSKAGKTSINKVFFEKASLEELEDLKPTMLRELHHRPLEIAKERISVVDLGGQSQFIPLHFQDSMVFSNVSALIFVIDLQNPARFEEAAQYFSKVADFIAKEKRKPSVTILFHKFDPEIQPQLLLSLDKALKSITRVLQPFQPTYFFTSIFSPGSIEEALINVLFRALPVEVLEQTLTSDVLLDAFHRIIPIYERVSKDRILPKEKTRLVLKELSAAIGGELAKRLIKKWHLFLCKNQPFEVSSNEPLVRITQKDVTRFELQCPLPKEKQDAIYCWVTYGLVEGLARVLGLGPVERIRTMAIDNVPSCAFISKYG
ncbi:MAG: ADP-ribosylation factor-like protein [Candidatus Heimdallarchaeota archaeon]